MARPAVLTVADTIAKSFLHVRGNPRRPAGDPRKEIRHLAADQLARVAADIQGHRLRPACHRLPARRRRLDHRQRGAGMGLCRHGHPVRRRRLIRHLSDRLLGRRSNISINDSSTKVIFAEDEEQLDKILSCRSRCPTLQKIVVFDMEGLSGFSDPMVLSLAEFMALGRNHEPGQRSAVGRDDRKPQRRRSRHPRLHVRHHGPAQGRDAFQPQRDASDAPRQRSVSVHRQRRAAGVPAALPRRRAGRRLLRLAGAGIGDEFRRKPGNGAGQSARGAADRVPGGAAGSGRSSIPGSRSR